MSLDAAAARELTSKIKKNTAAYARLIHQAWEQKVWLPLGYPSFQEWLSEELGLSRSRGYQLINIAVMEERMRTVGTGLPDAFILSDLSTRLITHFGVEEFLALYEPSATGSAEENEEAFLTVLASLRAAPSNGNVTALPVPQSPDHAAAMAVAALMAQASDLPSPDEVDTARLPVARGKVRDALAEVSALRQQYEQPVAQAAT